MLMRLSRGSSGHNELLVQLCRMPLEEQAQTVQSHKLVHQLDSAALSLNKLRKAAGGDYPRILAKLAAESVHHFVGLAGKAEDEPTLHGGDRGGSYRLGARYPP